MIPFWTFFFGVLAGILFCRAMIGDLSLPPASSRRIRRQRVEMRADLRRALRRIP